MADVKVEERGKYVTVKFLLGDEHLETLDEMLEYQTSRKLTTSEKVQVTYELLRSIIEDSLADWSWILADKSVAVIDIANDVIAESGGHNV